MRSAKNGPDKPFFRRCVVRKTRRIARFAGRPGSWKMVHAEQRYKALKMPAFLHAEGTAGGGVLLFGHFKPPSLACRCLAHLVACFCSAMAQVSVFIPKFSLHFLLPCPENVGRKACLPFSCMQSMRIHRMSDALLSPTDVLAKLV